MDDARHSGEGEPKEVEATPEVLGTAYGGWLEPVRAARQHNQEVTTHVDD